VFERHGLTPSGNALKEHTLTTAQWHFENDEAKKELVVPMDRFGSATERKLP
jgi:hypothetical protein